jgi:nicotinamide riboside transporter PnuC
MQNDTILSYVLWTTTAVALIGTVLNIKKNKYGFLLWIITNLIFAVANYFMGLPQQSLLFAVYFLLALWGWFSWNSAQKCDDEVVVEESCSGSSCCIKKFFKS